MSASISTSLRRRGEEVRSLLRELILEHSDVYEVVPSHGNVVSTSGTHGYGSLDESGRRLQSQALRKYRELSLLLRAVLRDAPSRAIEILDKSQREIEERIEQRELTWDRTTEEVIATVEAALARQLGLLNDLFDASDGEPIYVPDTNALLYNPMLDEWTFPNARRFSLVLTPMILGELDRLKIEHRNPEIRERAESLIRRIKGWRARGNLLEGVTLRRNVSTLRSIAVEPRVAETLPWLDDANEDDRLIAAAFDVMRDSPRAAVSLVTRDMNLQNKAAYCGLPFHEPPEPCSAR